MNAPLDDDQSPLFQAYCRERARQQRELVGTIVLVIIVAIIVFVAGMAATHSDDLPRIWKALAEY